MRFLTIIVFILSVGPALIAQEKQDADPKYELKTYYLGLLYKGSNRSQSAEEGNKIQKAHLEHLDSLHKKGILLIAGPIAGDHDLRGIVVLRVNTMEEAKALIDADPAVQAGRLRIELYPWMSQSLDVLAVK